MAQHAGSEANAASADRSAASAIYRSCVAHEELLRRIVALVPCELTRTEMDIMITLDTVQRRAMTPLSECVGATKEHTSRAVKALEEAGYVQRRRDEANHRVVIAQLTPAGESFLRGISGKALEQLDDMLDVLPAQQRSELAELSRRADELLCTVLEPKRNPYS